MKIGINARFLSKPFTGIGQYTKNLFTELAKIDSGNQYIFVTYEEIPAEIKKDFPKNAEIRIIKEKSLGSAGIKKTWWEQISLPKFFIKEKVDIAFFPYPSNPWTKDFYKKGIKVFVTVHDTIPWTHKNYSSKMLSRLYHSQTRKAVNKADIVLTVSNYSKQEIEKVCHTDSNKIYVIYNDADDIYKSKIESEFEDEILEKFKLVKDGFLLYCGGYDERKNIDKLVHEYSNFAKNNNDFSLVLAGGKILETNLYSSFDKIKNGHGEIIKTGFLAPEELHVLYKNCLAFVHLSTDEGFNIPIIEAANSSAPLIISDIPVHREIAKDAAIFINISKEGFCAQQMEKVLDRNFREKLKEKSHELSHHYSWKKSAQKLKDMLSSKQ